MTIHVTGDLFEIANALHASDAEVAIAHGTNLRGSTGGLAYFLFQRFPDALDTYRKGIEPVRRLINPPGLGKIHRTYNVPDIETGRLFTIINAFTQVDPGPHAHEDALVSCLNKMELHVDGAIVLPLIGGGIGGIHPARVIDLIMKMSDRFVLVTP